MLYAFFWTSDTTIQIGSLACCYELLAYASTLTRAHASEWCHRENMGMSQTCLDGSIGELCTAPCTTDKDIEQSLQHTKGFLGSGGADGPLPCDPPQPPPPLPRPLPRPLPLPPALEQRSIHVCCCAHDSCIPDHKSMNLWRETAISCDTMEAHSTSLWS